MSELKKGYLVDGRVFSTKSEAENYMRIPQVKAALTDLTEAEDSAEWIFNNKAAIFECYKAGSIRRVTKAEKAELKKALDEVTSGFLNDYRDAIVESFRWPSVKREDSPEELVMAAFMDLVEDNEDLAKWLIANKANIEAAFDTGKVKREVSPKAIEALAKYRADQAKAKAEKEAKEAAAAK